MVSEPQFREKRWVLAHFASYCTCWPDMKHWCQRRGKIWKVKHVQREVAEETLLVLPYIVWTPGNFAALRRKCLRGQRHPLLQHIDGTRRISTCCWVDTCDWGRGTSLMKSGWIVWSCLASDSNRSATVPSLVPGRAGAGETFLQS